MATLTQNVYRAIDDFNSIENAIVQKGVPVPDGTPTSEYAEKVEDVFEAGKKSEYDAFWDAAQLNGNRNRYEGFGAGVGTPSEIWKKPKYPFVIGGRPNQFFRDFNTSYGTDSGGSANLYSRPMDLSSWEIDTSQVTGALGFFQNASVANLTLDLSNADTLQNAFLSSNRGCANNISIKVSEKCQSFYLAFWYNSYSSYTTNVVRFIEGSVIAASDLNLSFCKQSKESLASVISALSSTTTGLAVTLRLAAVNTAFETTAGAADGSTSDEWTALIATKPNWTINLINS